MTSRCIPASLDPAMGEVAASACSTAVAPSCGAADGSVGLMVGSKLIGCSSWKSRLSAKALAENGPNTKMDSHIFAGHLGTDSNQAGMVKRNCVIII